MMKYPKIEENNKMWIWDQSIDILAAPNKVWPWLAQMGNTRAGWYSYDWIDNLGRQSLTTINPNFTQIQRGQKIPFAVISDFVPHEFLTFQFGSRATVTYLLEPKEHQTRLWSRLRVKAPTWLMNMTLGPAHAFMQNKQFAEIKKRVEKQNQ